MDLLDRLQDLAAKIRKQRELIQTEEAAKNALREDHKWVKRRSRPLCYQPRSNRKVKVVARRRIAKYASK